MKIAFLTHDLVGQGGLIIGQKFINALVRVDCGHQYLSKSSTFVTANVVMVIWNNVTWVKKS
jgi:hypothetical protein